MLFTGVVSGQLVRTWKLGESWREITASLPASTLTWLATTVSNTDSSNSDMSRVFTAVSRIALSFSLKNKIVNLVTRLSWFNLLSMMSSDTLNPAWPPPHWIQLASYQHQTGHCNAPLTVSNWFHIRDPNNKFLKPFDQTIILHDHDPMCQSEVIQDRWPSSICFCMTDRGPRAASLDPTCFLSTPNRSL